MSNGSYSVLIKNRIKKFKKVINVPSDKSISIRSFLISAISNDISKIKNPLVSEDVISCINCLKNLGVKIKKDKNNNFLVYGKGLGSLYAKKNTILNFGNSGTLARLLIGILSTTPNIRVRVMGDESLNKRNMSRLIKVMNRFGAEFLPKNKYNFPLTLVSSEMPIGIDYISGDSAQIKSSVILAGLNSYGNSEIIEKKETRDHTEKILSLNSKSIKIEKNKNLIKVFGKKSLGNLNIQIPSDPSSAAFFSTLCLLTKNSKIIIKNVCLNQKRLGFYNLLKKSGARIKMVNVKKKNNELVGDILVRSSKIRPIKSGSKHYLSATDEYPIMFIIAALTKGISKFTGIKELANKESNRILEMKKILKKIGVKCKSNKDSMTISGNVISNKKKHIIKVNSMHDHRIAMSCAVLALITGIKFSIKGFETVDTSFPSFLKIVKNLGGKYEIKKK